MRRRQLLGLTPGARPGVVTRPLRESLLHAVRRLAFIAALVLAAAPSQPRGRVFPPSVPCRGSSTARTPRPIHPPARCSSATTRRPPGHGARDHHRVRDVPHRRALRVRSRRAPVPVARSHEPLRVPPARRLLPDCQHHGPRRLRVSGVRRRRGEARRAAVRNPTVPDQQTPPAPGAMDTIVGFGRAGGDSQDYGLKRVATVTTAACVDDISDLTSVCWQFAGPGGNTCNGDSGGPLFTDAGGVAESRRAEQVKTVWPTITATTQTSRRMHPGSRRRAAPTSRASPAGRDRRWAMRAPRSRARWTLPAHGTPSRVHRFTVMSGSAELRIAMNGVETAAIRPVRQARVEARRRRQDWPPAVRTSRLLPVRVAGDGHLVRAGPALRGTGDLPGDRHDLRWAPGRVRKWCREGRRGV